jgi:phage terminase large subunit-like protein
MKDFQAISQQYISDILSGNIPACELTKLACRRQLDDLARTDWQYEYNHRAGARVCSFVEKCPHVKGRKFAGKPLILSPYQVFLLMTAFSWLGKHDGLRRFRRVYTEISKGNGKSPLLAALTIYMAFVDKEPGAEVYNVAWSVAQIKKTVFGTAQQMLRKMPKFCAKYGIEVGEESLYQRSSGSSIKPLSRNAGVAEGSLPYFTCVDELHIHAKRDLFDSLVTSNEKRDGSMLWVITTAGTDIASVCHEEHEYLVDILNGGKKDETFFGCIWTIDKEDDLWNEKTWQKANPNWGVSVNPESVRQEAERAKQKASAQPAFMTKHLDIWCNDEAQWLDPRRLLACADKTLREEQFTGQMGVIGLDLGRKNDLLAMVTLFWKQIDGKRHYYAFLESWTPQASLEKSDNASYQGWATNNFLRVCDGEENDYTLVAEEIRKACKVYSIIEIGFDPWGATETVQKLMREGLSMHQVDQNTRELSEPMKELEAAIDSKRFHYDGNPIMTWALLNVINKPDNNDNYFPRKKGGASSPHKIDPASALFDALNRCTALHVTGKVRPRRTEVLVFD